MSTFAYAQLTNARELAIPGTSSTTSSPGINTYIDAFTALVPAEVLTLHAFIISATTQTCSLATAGTKAVANSACAAVAGNAASGTTTTVLPQAIGTLSASFWGLVVLSVALYAVPRYLGGKWDNFDWIRALIAPLAFVGWTMLQRATAFDAAFPEVDPVGRTVAALFLGAVLGGVTAAQASKADAKASS
jgi:hypothetical protein